MIEFVGMPYDIKNDYGVNCWGLVALVYSKVLKKELTDYPCSTNNIRDIASTFTAAFANGSHGFSIVKKPENYDVVVFRKPCRFGEHFHCGIMFDGKVLHSASRSGGVVYEPLHIAGRGFKEVEFWRQ